MTSLPVLPIALSVGVIFFCLFFFFVGISLSRVSVQSSHAVSSNESVATRSSSFSQVITPTSIVFTPIPTMQRTVYTPVVSPKQAAAVSTDDSVWDRLAQCESGGNWADNTGNGFYGGLQFTLGTWQGVGGVGMPNEASRDEQIARAKLLQSRRGFAPWPACSRKLGLL